MKRLILPSLMLSATLLVGCSNGNEEEITTYKSEMSDVMQDYRNYNVEILQATKSMLYDNNDMYAQDKYLRNYEKLVAMMKESLTDMNVPEEYEAEHKTLLTEMITYSYIAGEIGTAYLERGSVGVVGVAEATDYIEKGKNVEDLYMNTIENGDGTDE